jgi:hypothetical protein
MKVMTMGLDMYAFKTKATITKPVDFTDDDALRIHAWRKHPNLHGWMESLYRTKGGAAESFNVTNVQLTAEDIDALEFAIREKILPDTTGFFFGESDGSEVEDDLGFVAKARDALKAGYLVFYASWW